MIIEFNSYLVIALFFLISICPYLLHYNQCVVVIITCTATSTKWMQMISTFETHLNLNGIPCDCRAKKHVKNVQYQSRSMSDVSLQPHAHIIHAFAFVIFKLNFKMTRCLFRSLPLQQENGAQHFKRNNSIECNCINI